MYNPISHEFSARLIAIDRCQVILLRSLALHYSNRLALKGGMAMRALFGSLRLTKDIDFERDPSLSNESLEKSLPRAMASAALESGLRGPTAKISKHTRTTIRASLNASHAATGEPVQFEVEISGRGLPPASHLIRLDLQPPAEYFIAPFGVTAFDQHAMAASKVAALHSDHRSVPRDIYDLNDLIGQQADATELLRLADAQWLLEIQNKAIEKTSLIGWDRANEELFPYLPKSVAQSITTERWEEICLRVALQVDEWVAKAVIERT